MEKTFHEQRNRSGSCKRRRNHLQPDMIGLPIILDDARIQLVVSCVVELGVPVRANECNPVDDMKGQEGLESERGGC